ncbi:hypothetical protein SAMN05192533_1129 [Mesobacillus persicus]|uniref:Uncharacterized protein n=1 Tax=Mesobacillus persicus TaxID=930146 RepID=A0A1H8FXM9_9BACI|nr:hypothetical protein SAMN05192533_1129 [Mesobacillus persicus]
MVNGLIAALAYAKENTIYHLTNSNPPTNQLVFDLIKESLHLTNLEMVPTDYQGELTLEEQKFNEPIRIFYNHCERSIQFDDSNTKQLLKDAQLEPLELTKDILRKIIINSLRSTEGIPTS